MNSDTYTVTAILISNCTGMLLVRELVLVVFALSLRIQKAVLVNIEHEICNESEKYFNNTEKMFGFFVCFGLQEKASTFFQ